MAPRLQSEKSNKTQEKISQGCFFINLQPQGTVCIHFRFHSGSKVSERRISFIGEERGNAGSLIGKHFLRGDFGNGGDSDRPSNLFASP